MNALAIANAKRHLMMTSVKYKLEWKLDSKNGNQAENVDVDEDEKQEEEDEGDRQ